MPRVWLRQFDKLIKMPLRVLPLFEMICCLGAQHCGFFVQDARVNDEHTWLDVVRVNLVMPAI